MFSSWKNLLVFCGGLGLTVGLLLTPTLIPGGWGYKTGLQWSGWQIIGAAILGVGLLGLTLWIAGHMVRGAETWKQGRVIGAIVLIVLVANGLYMFLIDAFALHSGWRALIAVLGVPVIYGNLGRELGKISLRESMVNILSGALATMGAAFIIAVILRGW